MIKTDSILSLCQHWYISNVAYSISLPIEKKVSVCDLLVTFADDINFHTERCHIYVAVTNDKNYKAEYNTEKKYISSNFFSFIPWRHAILVF